MARDVVWSEPISVLNSLPNRERKSGDQGSSKRRTANLDAEREIIRRFGERPMGLFVYTPDGPVSIQISNPANPACIAPGKKSGPGKKDDLALPACNPKQMRALLDGTVTYWGSYTVDLSAGVVTHNVLSDVSNGYAGTVQPRPFRLNGNRLVIGDGKTWTRVLERVGR